MITIKKDGQTLTVAKEAFKTFFAPMGWTESDGPETDRKSNRMHPQPEKIGDLGTLFPPEDKTPQSDENLTRKGKSAIKNEDILPTDDEVEVPLSEMTLNQLIEFADANNIDIFGISGKKSILRAIENALKG